MKKTLCLLLFLAASASFSLAAAPADPADDPEEWGWSGERALPGFKNEVTLWIVADDSFENIRMNYAKDAKSMPIGEFLGFAYSNIGKKDALWIGVIAKSGKQDDPVNVDKDNFKINVLPRFINAGFQRVILSVGNETYDTDKDPFMKRLIEDLKNEKRKYWTSALQYGKQLKKYSLEKRDPNSRDVLEQNGYMSFEKLKELGEAGDDWAYYFYATAHIRPIGYAGSLDGGYPQKVDEGVEILKKLSGRGVRMAAEELALFYGLGGEYEDEAVFEKYKNAELAEEYMKTAYTLGSNMFTCALIKSACGRGDYLLADSLAESSEANRNGLLDEEYDDDAKTYWDDREDCAYSILRCVSKNEKNWPVPEMICFCYQSTSFPYFGSTLEIKDPVMFGKWAKVLAEARPYSDRVMYRIHSLANAVGCKMDLKKAFDTARRASFARYKYKAMTPMAYTAYAYEKGLGVAKNESHAKAYWDRFYSYVHHESGRQIAYTASCLYNGFGFPEDKAKALEIMEKCVEIAERYMEDESKKSDIIESVSYAEPCLNELINICSGNFGAEDKNEGKARFYKAKAGEFKKRIAAATDDSEDDDFQIQPDA